LELKELNFISMSCPNFLGRGKGKRKYVWKK